ncbi:Uncharacterised protein [Mycobacteroides abscessus subsp. abscessus]|nr:Uncharacterised protein [Mycobacteroides abscessus subsp. abscessus]SIC60562.1 Uncharacterised protein [Mycobacteroides abscessus subsp. abscessus]SKK21266.1 Uncharacterised protein [Mycobacteroides abscessus subsp. abscessus]SKP50606.1 Uncharacterised protein [Mycobacteroides abscessus subsp. abscessus]
MPIQSADLRFHRGYAPIHGLSMPSVAVGPCPDPRSVHADARCVHVPIHGAFMPSAGAYVSLKTVF